MLRMHVLQQVMGFSDEGMIAGGELFVCNASKESSLVIFCVHTVGRRLRLFSR